MIGLPVEIEAAGPAVRPLGRQHVSRHCEAQRQAGSVRHGGSGVQQRGESRKDANDAFITQVVKTDANGVFAYTMPWAGWWGFAALIDGAEKRKGPDGQPAAVELGGLMWVKAVEMKDEGPKGKK